jgi:hypothetical protein
MYGHARRRPRRQACIGRRRAALTAIVRGPRWRGRRPTVPTAITAIPATSAVVADKSRRTIVRAIIGGSLIVRGAVSSYARTVASSEGEQRRHCNRRRGHTRYGSAFCAHDAGSAPRSATLCRRPASARSNTVTAATISKPASAPFRRGLRGVMPEASVPMSSASPPTRAHTQITGSRAANRPIPVAISRKP